MVPNHDFVVYASVTIKFGTDKETDVLYMHSKHICRTLY